MPSSKSSQFSPSGLTKHLRSGSMRILQYNSDNLDGTVGFLKSSALYLLVHMEPSLRPSFYLRHNLRGYTVDTTAGFPVKIVEALSP
jgi:hypothetical protein